MRKFPRKLRFATSLAVVLCMSALDWSPAVAGLAPSQTSGATTITSARDADLVVVQRALENKVVAQKLRDYGVAPEDARLKLANASDRDLHTLATASRGLPTGGDSGIIELLVIVILVIVVLRLLHHDVIVR